MVPKRIAGRRRTVVVEAHNHTSEMRRVGLWSAKLVVRNLRPQAGRGGAGRQVLHLTSPPDVADHHVQLAVGTERDDAAVVVATWGLRSVALSGRLGRGVVLKCQQLDQVVVVDQDRKS